MGEKVRFDPVDGFFYIDGEQLYWSSVYLLDRSAKAGYSLKEACQDLGIDPVKGFIVKREVETLRDMYLIKYSKERFFLTDKGRYILDTIKVQQKGADLKTKALADLETVTKDCQAIDPAIGLESVLEDTEVKPTQSNVRDTYVINIIWGVLSSLVLLSFSLIFLLNTLGAWVCFLLGLLAGYYPGKKEYERIISKWWYIEQRDYLSRRWWYFTHPFTFFPKSIPMTVAIVLTFFYVYADQKHSIFDPRYSWAIMLLFGLLIGNTVLNVRWLMGLPSSKQ
jgi:hypothetical protein